MVRARVLALTFLLVAALAPAARSAPDDRAKRAIESANTGLELYERGQWDAALEKFREADRLYHSPAFLLYRARTLGRAGRWRQALEAYDELLREALPSDAPPAWRSAHGDARSEKAALEREVPSVVVESSARARVTIDGEPAALGKEIALDPGRHLIRVSEGRRASSREVQLEPREKRRRVKLTLPPAETRRAEPGALTPGLVVTGIGGAALLAGGVVGVFALTSAKRAKDDLPETCDGNVCPRSRRAEIEESTSGARTLAKVSTGLVIGGAVVLAGGVVLWLSEGDKPARSATRNRSFRVEF